MKRLAVLLLVMTGLPAVASEDHDAARDALRADEVRPLAEIIPDIESRFGGRMIDADFERRRGGYIYELELITETGRMIEVVVDAASGDILEVEKKHWSEKDD